MSDTIFALSSGAPPAAIAVIRISGPDAGHALTALAGSRPEPRVATLRRLRDSSGETLDHALILWFAGPATVTGEDLAELHLHGGRAVVAAVEQALAAMPGLRRAQPGEFTRRAFASGRIDLAEAEGLADLLTAETQMQRRQALALAGGALSNQVVRWREQILEASAAVEAVLDFGDEDDVASSPLDLAPVLAGLIDEIGSMLAAPRVESLREGFRVALAGPPNAGKSSLFNLLVGEEAAITAPIAGTTRDVLVRPVSIDGVPFTFVDTAGLHEEAISSIEIEGIARARMELERADLLLWLGIEGEGPEAKVWEIESFADMGPGNKPHARHRVSALNGIGLDDLRADLIAAARASLPKPGMVAINQRQHDLLEEGLLALDQSTHVTDPLIIAECLRSVRGVFDRLLGRSAPEDMLDALFGRFCIGK